MPKGVLLLLAAVVVLSGCASPSSKSSSSATPQVQYQDAVVQVAAPTMPRGPVPAGERNLTAAPQWHLGEYWKYRMTDLFTGQSYDFLRVVAGEDRAAGNYLVGFPKDEFSNDVMVLHIPGYGDIKESDLSYETHDKPFQPLKFPLTDGEVWDMAFEGTAKGQAVVSLPGDGTAKVTMSVSNYGYINATYDPRIGEISHLEIQGYAYYDVIAHGYDYSGVVRVPHAHDLIFQHGRLAGVADLSQPLVPPTVRAPTDTVVVGPGYDRASFIIALGAGPFLGVPNNVPVGVFQETVTAPDQTKFTLQLLPTEGGFKMQAYGFDNPEGTWTMQHIAGGAGIAFVEGIAYHSIDVDLPSGCVINSVQAAHHNANCKIDASQAGKVVIASSSTSSSGA